MQVSNMLETKQLPQNIIYETTCCDLCGSHDLKLWDRARSNSLSKCKQCGLVFTNPRISVAENKNYLLYSESYFKQKSRMTEKLITARSKSYQSEIKKLQIFVKCGRILDVGCGMGGFLASLGSNWEKHGCDISTYALNHAKTKGIITYHGEFEYLDFNDFMFDVIYFRASMHHAYSPIKCLEKAFKLLKPNGILAIIMSNNCSSVCGLLFRGHIKSYEQAHNYLFSKNSLKRYLLQSGYKILAINYPYFGTGYESLKDFILLPLIYAKYVNMKISGRLNQVETYDFSSPSFYGNYINIYAKNPKI